jgi:hypothetical protein
MYFSVTWRIPSHPGEGRLAVLLEHIRPGGVAGAFSDQAKSTPEERSAGVC